MSDISSLLGGFDPDAYETSDNFEPLPPGEYPVMIEDAEVKDTKAGDGKYIKLKLLVTGENYNGRKVFANINIVNPNQQAVQIGLRDLASLTKAVGLPTVEDTSELIDKCLTIRLKVKDGQNEVSNYKPVGAVTSAPKQPAQAPVARSASKPSSAQPAAPVAKKMPWQK